MLWSYCHWSFKSGPFTSIHQSLTHFWTLKKKRGDEAAGGDPRREEAADLCVLFGCRDSDAEFKGRTTHKYCRWDLLTDSIQHLGIFAPVCEVTCTVHMDVLDPGAFHKCSRSGVKRPGPSLADSRRTSHVSLSLLSSSLLQTATDPHGHHLCVTVIILYDEGMVLKYKERETEVLCHFHSQNKWHLFCFV